MIFPAEYFHKDHASIWGPKDYKERYREVNQHKLSGWPTNYMCTVDNIQLGQGAEKHSMKGILKTKDPEQN